MDISLHSCAGRSYSTGIVRAQAVAAPEAEHAEQSIASDIHGFELVQQQWVAEYNSTVLLYKHKKTGLLQCLSVCMQQRPASFWNSHLVLSKLFICLQLLFSCLVQTCTA